MLMREVLSHASPLFLLHILLALLAVMELDPGYCRFCTKNVMPGGKHGREVHLAMNPFCKAESLQKKHRLGMTCLQRAVTALGKWQWRGWQHLHHPYHPRGLRCLLPQSGVQLCMLTDVT